MWTMEKARAIVLPSLARVTERQRSMAQDPNKATGNDGNTQASSAGKQKSFRSVAFGIGRAPAWTGLRSR
jgi:hypothetical protein